MTARFHLGICLSPDLCVIPLLTGTLTGCRAPPNPGPPPLQSSLNGTCKDPLSIRSRTLSSWWTHPVETTAQPPQGPEAGLGHASERSCCPLPLSADRKCSAARDPGGSYTGGVRGEGNKAAAQRTRGRGGSWDRDKWSLGQSHQGGVVAFGGQMLSQGVSQDRKPSLPSSQTLSGASS